MSFGPAVPDAAQPPVVLDLGGPWTVATTDRRIELGADPIAALTAAGATLLPAVVPGNLELDLLRNGVIDEPFVGMGVVPLRRLEGVYAYYLRTFQAPHRGATSPVLVFEGLDCDARVFLNGRLVAQTANMLIEHHVPVAEALLDGSENLLVVELAPVDVRAREQLERYAPGLQAEGGGYASLFVRKAPHVFGWDIMPRALSAGIWRAVTLRYLAPERIVSLWLDTEGIDSAGDSATLALHYQVAADLDPAHPVELMVAASGSAGGFSMRVPLLAHAGMTRWQIGSPALWWPRGRGPAHLYSVVVRLVRDGLTIDERTFRHGIRTVALDRTSLTDTAGSGEFRFIVNGEPVFILGTNWVPLDAYHSRDLERIPAALALVEELGCNMIRCWGGNVYEHDRFYDGCDEAGILVWQDFSMACAIYPQDQPFQDEIAGEVRQVVRRLRQHPSVVLWAGDNECDEQYVWKGRRRDPNDNVLTRHVIPAVLRDEDPSRPYLPSSPYVDPVAFASGVRALPEDHLWGPRDYYKSGFYVDAVAHFASEIGYHGCPDVGSLRRFLSPDHMWPYAGDPEWLLHATSPFPGVDTHDYRVELMASQVRTLFGAVPDTLEAFVMASQASQAEALKFFIESFRIGKWRRTGIIWWNLLDGWPQLSDAIVDYYFVRKRAFEVVKRAQVPVALMLREPRDGRQEAVISNDTRHDVAVTFTVRDSGSGETLITGTAAAPGDAVVAVGEFRTPPGQALLTLDWESAAGSVRNHYLAGRPPFPLEWYLASMERAGF
jgi:beta-mannosidase